MVKNILKLGALITILASLTGCAQKKLQVSDGPSMMYKDSDYRSIYANVLDFDSYAGQPYFAVAFLGYGDRMEARQAYVEGVFESLDALAIEKVEHIDYEGDEWYLIVPRYREAVDITNLETSEVHRIYQGEAFTVKCNLSDLQPNIEISTVDSGEHRFSPQISSEGRLVTNADVWDITDYSVMDENMYVQGIE